MNNANNHDSFEILNSFLPYFFDPSHFSSHFEAKREKRLGLEASSNIFDHCWSSDRLFHVLYPREQLQLECFRKKPTITKSSALKMAKTSEVSTLLSTQSWSFGILSGAFNSQLGNDSSTRALPPAPWETFPPLHRPFSKVICFPWCSAQFCLLLASQIYSWI